MIYVDQKTTKHLGYNPSLMKRLFFINLLILIFTTNVMASVVSTACSYGTSPTTVEAENMGQHTKHQNHSAAMMDSQMQMMSDCCSGIDGGSVTDHECGDCQFHCSGSVLLPEASNIQTVESIATHSFLMPSLLSIAKPRLLRPPRLS